MTSQDQTRSQLHDWSATAAAAVQNMIQAARQSPSAERQVQERQARYEHVMGWEPSERLLAARDTIDEVRDWNSGQGHLIVTGPGLPVPALDSLALLGFEPATIEAAVADRIDADGNLTTEDIVAATAELTGVTGTEEAYLQNTHDRATSREALHDAEEGAYHDEFIRVSELPLPDLLAETGHTDLTAAGQAVAERHGYATFDDFDQALMSDYRNDAGNQLHADLSITEAAIWAAADTDHNGDDTSTDTATSDVDADEDLA